ncbi:MAG: orotate phosphoribosyltransferase [Opitutales bacterium]|nr:orotate phosphoribosyltransferase [Opitutales bacterium]
MNQEQTLEVFRSSGALLQGHFILRSGLRSEYFFQCARVGEDLEKISLLAEALLEKAANLSFETVLAPAMGGLVIGQEVARQSKARYIFAEKVDDHLALRRNFTITKGEKILIVEDVITRGGRALEAINLAREVGGDVVALAVLADRSQGKAQFPVPHFSLLELDFPTYDPNNLPPHLQDIEPIKPGS